MYLRWQCQGAPLELRHVQVWPHLRPAQPKSTASRQALPPFTVLSPAQQPKKLNTCIQPHRSCAQSSRHPGDVQGNVLHTTKETQAVYHLKTNTVHSSAPCPSPATLPLVMLRCTKGWEVRKSDAPAVICNLFPTCSFFFPYFFHFLIKRPLCTYTLGFCLIFFQGGSF